MRHVMALAVKVIMVAAVLEIVLGIMTRLDFVQIIYISVATTLLAYIIGDLFILPATNDTIASVADVGLAFVSIYAFNYFYPRGINFIGALFASVVLGVSEAFFHRYVANYVLQQRGKA